MSLENMIAIKNMNKKRNELLEKEKKSMERITKIRSMLAIQYKELLKDKAQIESEISQIDSELLCFMHTYELETMSILNTKMNLVSKVYPKIHNLKDFLTFVDKNDYHDLLNKNICKRSEVLKMLDKGEEVVGIELCSTQQLKVSTLDK